MIAISFSSQNYEALIFGSLIMTAISTFFYYGWLWSIGTRLAEWLPAEQDHNITAYRIAVLIPIFFLFLIFVGGYFIFPALIGVTASLSFLIFLIYIPILFSFFYLLYHGAKVIKAAELQRSVTFSDFVGEFFLLWFYIIGVWILQPKINEIINRENDRFHDTIDHLVE